MKKIETEMLCEVGGGLNAAACANAAIGGFGVGAVAGGAVGLGLGSIGGPGGAGAGAALGAAVGGLAMGAAAISGNAACAPAAPSCSGTGCGGGGGGKVICTELCRNGVIEHDVWMADIRYSREHFSEQTMRGYHLWGIPYVKLMRKSPVFANIAAHPTRWFAEDIAYRMGVRAMPNRKGWVLREVFFRPICSVLGVFAKARDWQALWRTDATGARLA